MKHNVLNLSEMLAKVTPSSGKKIIATSAKGNSIEFPFLRLYDQNTGLVMNLPELVFTSGEWALRYTAQTIEAHRTRVVNYKISDFEKIELA